MAEDRIRLAGIRATGFHGVLDHERRDGQEFTVDVVLRLDTRAAAATDDLSQTVDYSAVAAQVYALIVGEPVDLIETLAEQIAAAVLGHDRVAAVEVVVHKPHAPVGVVLSDVTVEIARTRETLAVLAPAPTLEPVLEPLAEPLLEPPGGAAGLAGLALASLPVDLLAEPVDRLDLAPVEPAEVVLALGSNLGSSQQILRSAVSALAALPGVELTAVGPLARTAAVGGPAQPDFLNTVVLGRTTLSPRGLLHACQGIEQAHDRRRDEHWGPRTLDIDLIVYGTTMAVSDDLELPHPRACERAFVLQPWAQIAPDAVLPGLGGGPVSALAGTAPDRQGVRWLALDWWSPAEPG